MCDLHDIKDREPNMDLVEHLTKMLEDAMSGELRAMYYVVQFDDNRADTGWQTDPRCEIKPIVAELSILQTRLSLGLIDIEDDE